MVVSQSFASLSAPPLRRRSPLGEMRERIDGVLVRLPGGEQLSVGEIELADEARAAGLAVGGEEHLAGGVDGQRGDVADERRRQRTRLFSSSRIQPGCAASRRRRSICRRAPGDRLHGLGLAFEFAEHGALGFGEVDQHDGIATCEREPFLIGASASASTGV